MQPSINQLLVHREGMEHAGEESFFLDQLNLMSTLLKCSEILMEGHFHLDMQGTPCCLKGQAVVSMVSLALLQGPGTAPGIQQRAKFVSDWEEAPHLCSQRRRQGLGTAKS